MFSGGLTWKVPCSTSYSMHVISFELRSGIPTSEGGISFVALRLVKLGCYWGTGHG